ncbi:MAG: hypothetical protein QM831_16415 [Kofleriaceae bacterium]
MGRSYLVMLALLGACHARLGDPGQQALDTDSGVSIDGPDGSGSIDAPPALGPWGTPATVTGAASTANNEDDPTLSSDGLELYYAIQPVAGGNKDLYVMKRNAVADPFGAPTALTGFNTMGTDEGPRLAYDDLTIYFGRDGDIFKSTRANKGGTWGAPSVVAGVSTAQYEKWLAVCGTNNQHFMVSRLTAGTGGTQDLYEGDLGAGAGTIVAELSDDASSDISTFLSKDCLTVYFASNRGGNTQIYYSTRATMADAWNAPQLAPAPFDTGTDNEDAGYTPDNKIFVFSSTRAGNGSKDLYISTR